MSRRECLDAAIYYNLMTLRQRRRIYDWTRIVKDESVFPKLLAHLQRLINVLKVFDGQLDYFAAYIYRAEAEPAVVRAEMLHMAPRDLAAMDRLAADEWLQRTVGAARSIYKRRRVEGEPVIGPDGNEAYWDELPGIDSDEE